MRRARRNKGLICRFSKEARARIREAKRLIKQGVPQSELDPDLQAALRLYDNARKANKPMNLADGRVNEDYHNWLRKHGYPLKPFQHRLYQQWRRRQVDHGLV